MKNFFQDLKQKEGFKSVCASILCILAGILVGFVVMMILSLFNDRIGLKNAFQGLGILLGGPFSSGTAKYIITNLGYKEHIRYQRVFQMEMMLI